MAYVQFTNSPDDEIVISDEEMENNLLLEIGPFDPPQRMEESEQNPPDRVAVTREKSIRSKVFQKLFKSEGLLFCLISTIFITNCAARGYLQGVIMLIQHTLNVSDGEMVVTDIMFDFGIIVGALAIISMRKKLNRPKLIGSGALAVGIGCFLVSGPYFSYASNHHRYSSPGDAILKDYEMCYLEGEDANLSTSKPEVFPPYKVGGAEFWVVFGAGIMGLGAAPQLTAGLPYLEDVYKGRKTPFLVALVLSAIATGTWFGELLSFAIQHGGDKYFGEFTTTSRWWLGFMLCGLHCMLFALLVFTFHEECPQLRKSKHKKSGNEEDVVLDQTDSFYYMRLDDPAAQKNKLVTFLKHNLNIVFFAVGLSLEASILTGFTVYQPRFYGIVSGVGVVKADLAFASATLLALTVGFIVSSIYLLFAKLSQRQLARMVIFISFSTLLSCSVLFLFECQDAPIRGVPHLDDPINLQKYVQDVFNSTDHCGKDCVCLNPTSTLLCGVDDVTYLSPCVAGCSSVTKNSTYPYLTFADCSCIDSKLSQTAIPGPCPAKCVNHAGHMAILFIVYILTGLQICPAVYLLLRGSKAETRVGTLGFTTITWRILGTIPALGYFKAILDHSCMFWTHPDPSEVNYRECQLYNSSSYHFHFLTLVTILKTVVFLLYIGAWYHTKDEDKAKTIADAREIRYERLNLDDEESTEGEPPPTPI